MLQQPEGDDYILATGQAHSVREFVELAARIAGFDVIWEGEGKSTKGIDTRTGRVIVRVNPALYRPAEVDLLVGNPAKARERLGWTPKVSFEQLVEMMVEADLRRAARGRLLF